MTVRELQELLKQYGPHQKIVFSDMFYGDFDLVGDTGARLSEDNFNEDIRPIFRIIKRRD